MSQLTEEQRKLVSANMRLAPWTISRLRACGHPCISQLLAHGYEEEDLMQIAATGLVRAAQEWDPTRGCFTTIAVLMCRAALERESVFACRRCRDTRPRTLLGDDVAAPTAVDLDQADARHQLGRLLQRLHARDRCVLELRFGLGGASPMALAAVGNVLGVSPERIRQLEYRAITKLRQLVH